MNTDKNYELIKEYQETKDENILNILIEDNKGLLVLVINDILKLKSDPVYDLDDYYQIGTMELEKAFTKYDFDRGTTFSTFAVRCIKNKIIGIKIRIDKRELDCISLDEALGKLDSSDNLKYEDIISYEKNSNHTFETIKDCEDKIYLLSLRNILKDDFELFELKSAGYSYYQIADMKGVSEPAIYQKMKRLRKKVKNYDKRTRNR